MDVDRLIAPVLPTGWEALATLAAVAGVVAGMARVAWLPTRERNAGYRVRVGVFPRARYQAPVLVPLLLGAFGVASLGGTVVGAIGPLAALVVVLSLPMRYTVTPNGIGLGRRAPRRWTEFAGARRRAGRVYLQPFAGSRGMVVWLPRDRDDDDLVATLRRRMRECHRGAASSDPLPARAVDPTPNAKPVWTV